MTSVSAGHIILTPTQPVGSGQPQRESNPGPPHQESSALPTELPRPPVEVVQERKLLLVVSIHNFFLSTKFLFISCFCKIKMLHTSIAGYYFGKKKTVA